MSGKFKFFQGQGIVREFYVVSGKNELLIKCQGNVRENGYGLVFWIQASKIILKASELLLA